MMADYRKYYYYAHVDANKEALGSGHADSIGAAAELFSRTKNMNVQDFLKIYAIGLKNESK
jgi:hypothetical protein